MSESHKVIGFQGVGKKFLPQPEAQPLLRVFGRHQDVRRRRLRHRDAQEGRILGTVGSLLQRAEGGVPRSHRCQRLGQIHPAAPHPRYLSPRFRQSVRARQSGFPHYSRSRLSSAFYGKREHLLQRHASGAYEKGTEGALQRYRRLRRHWRLHRFTRLHVFQRHAHETRLCRGDPYGPRGPADR